jgi:hypothetical protein
VSNFSFLDSGVLAVLFSLSLQIKNALEGTGLKIDKAFFIAAERCGIDPMELVPRSKKSFRKPTEREPSDKVLEIRQQGYEQVYKNIVKKRKESQFSKFGYHHNLLLNLKHTNTTTLQTQGRQKKISRMVAEQENVRVMLKNKVDPKLIPIKQPWIVAGPGENSQKAAAEHSAAELVQLMIEEQEKRERDMKEAEK